MATFVRFRNGLSRPLRRLPRHRGGGVQDLSGALRQNRATSRAWRANQHRTLAPNNIRHTTTMCRAEWAWRLPDRHRRAAPTAHSRIIILTTTIALALTCLWVRTALSPGRPRAPKQARSSPFHRLADSTIVTSDWPPERRPPHHRGQQSHRSTGGFHPCGRQARTRRINCRMAACRRRPLLFCHRLCPSPSTRRYKICIVSVRVEFLGGIGVAALLLRQPTSNLNLKFVA